MGRPGPGVRHPDRRRPWTPPTSAASSEPPARPPGSGRAGRPANYATPSFPFSTTGVPVEEIARLAGHTSTRTTEIVYRRELRPILTTGAEIMDTIFKTAAAPTQVSRQARQQTTTAHADVSTRTPLRGQPRSDGQLAMGCRRHTSGRCGAGALPVADGGHRLLLGKPGASGGHLAEAVGPAQRRGESPPHRRDRPLGRQGHPHLVR